MAVQGTIQVQGGLTATNAYLRVSELTVKKIVNEGDSNHCKWSLGYGVHCYADADARANDKSLEPEARLGAPTVAYFWVTVDSEPTDPMAAAYADLKTQGAVTNATDLL